MDWWSSLVCVTLTHVHIAIAHGCGVWTTRATGASESGDVMIVATNSGLHQAIPAVNQLPLQCDFSDWTMEPPVLRTKIHDLQEAQWFSGYKPKLNEEPRSAVSILSEWFNLSPSDYCEMILAWMEDNIQNHPVALKWWSLRGQDWLYYCTVLHAGSAPDGLEFWAANRASGFHLNLVQ